MDIQLDNIYNCDCLEGMKHIPDGTVDAIICDLPYGTTACAWDSVIPFEPLWEQFRRVTKPNAAIVLFGSEPFSSALRMSNIKEYRYDWVWCKDYSTGFLDANRKPLKQHELISVFYRSLPMYNPQKSNVGKKVRVRRTGTMEGYHKHNVVADAVYDGNYPTSLLSFKHDRAEGEKGLHPTQKPVDLLRYLVLTYTNVGGGSIGCDHRQRHHRHRLREGEKALHRLRAEQGVFRHRAEAHRPGAAATDARLRARINL